MRMCMRNITYNCSHYCNSRNLRLPLIYCVDVRLVQPHTYIRGRFSLLYPVLLIAELETIQRKQNIALLSAAITVLRQGVLLVSSVKGLLPCIPCQTLTPAMISDPFQFWVEKWCDCHLWASFIV